MLVSMIFLAGLSYQQPRIIYLEGGVWGQPIQIAQGEKVILVGHSAGAHAAAFYALDPCNADRLERVVLMSGVYRVSMGVRLFTLTRHSDPRRFFRGVSKREASPLFNIPPASPNSPKFEIYYATLDLPGLKLQARQFYQALLEHGYCATLCEVRTTHRNIPYRLGY